MNARDVTDHGEHYKYRVGHIPQVPGPTFYAPARSLDEAAAISVTLATQHLWLLERGLVEDYSNIIFVEEWDEDDGEWAESDAAEDHEATYDNLLEPEVEGEE